jgi:hypothetical protein
VATGGAVVCLLANMGGILTENRKKPDLIHNN